LLSSAAARADVEINSKPTSNMSCEAGVCTATAQKAVLNVGDLQTMLASGDVAVKTGTVAKDIVIAQPLTWSSSSRLTLDARRSVQINKQVTVAGQGSLTVTTNDIGSNGRTAKGKSGGEFIIVPERGSVQFWDTASSLIIDGNSYTLVYDIKTLASDIAANPSGFYALAKPYDASADGAYSSSPIATTLDGTLEGLGNAVSNLTIKFPTSGTDGLFDRLGSGSVVSQVGLVNATLEGTVYHGAYGGVGPLAGVNYGHVKRAYASGTVSVPLGTNELTGGLVGDNEGTILNCYTSTDVSAGGEGIVGGIASLNYGLIEQSFSTGKLKSAVGNYSPSGIAGYNGGRINNTYSLAKVNQKGNCCGGGGYYGGLVGQNLDGAEVSTSYAAGKTGHTKRSGATGGGLIGFDSASPGSVSASYWDLDTGVNDPAQGAGNIDNDPGITGLTDAQLKSGLPNGFSPKIWCQSARINNGYPYLCALPPP